MNTFLIKNKNILPAGLASAILLLVLFLPTYSHAYWSIEGSATNNTFQIGSLETIVSDNDLNASFSRTSGDTVQFTITDNGTLTGTDTIHKLEATPDTCAPSFYQGIDVTLDIDNNTVHDDTLATLDATSTDEGTVEIELTANSNLQAAENETCEVTLTLDSYQTHFADNTYGFSVSHTISLTITASEAIGPQPTTNVVLNEIYPATLSTTTVPLEREWIELYNGTNNPIDVFEWSISEFTSGSTTLAENSHTIVGDCTGHTVSDHMQPYNTNDTVVPAGGYLVLEFCGSAEYLYDDGDTVSLYDGVDATTGTLIDSHTYPETTNGKSHQRIPDGGTWVDPIPTPGKPNHATREDLEAEGWDEEEIEKVLLELENPVKSGDSKESPENDDSVKTKVNEAGEKDEDKKEGEIDESARNEDEVVDEEDKETNDDEEKQKVNEDEDPDKSEQEKNEEELGDDDKKEKDEDKEQDDNKKVDEDKDPVKSDDFEKSSDNDVEPDKDEDTEESDNEKEGEKEDLVKDEDSKENSSDEVDDSVNDKSEEKQDEIKDSQEKSDNNDEDADLEDKEDKQNSAKEDTDEQQAKVDLVKSDDLEKSSDNEAGDNTN